MNEKECGLTSDYANCVRFEMASYIFYIPEDHHCEICIYESLYSMEGITFTTLDVSVDDYFQFGCKLRPREKNTMEDIHLHVILICR